MMEWMLKWQLYAVRTTGSACRTFLAAETKLPPRASASGSMSTGASLPLPRAVTPRTVVVTVKASAMAIDIMEATERRWRDLRQTRGRRQVTVTTKSTNSLEVYHGASSPVGVPNITGRTPRMSEEPTRTSLAMIR